MTSEPPFRVVPFAKHEYTPSDYSAPQYTWKEFYRFRNALLRVLKPYGTIGPMGELPILEDWETSERAWNNEDASSNPDFFVVSDMYNQHDRWNRVEASASLVSADLLQDVIAMLWAFPKWSVYFFAGARSIEEVSERCASTKRT
jgi:hypothetical protein